MSRLINMLTNDPGVFSEVSVSSELATAQLSSDVVGIIGTGTEYKKISIIQPTPVAVESLYFYPVANMFSTEHGNICAVSGNAVTTVPAGTYEIKYMLYSDSSLWGAEQTLTVTMASDGTLSSFSTAFNNISGNPFIMYVASNKAYIVLKNLSTSTNLLSFVITSSDAMFGGFSVSGVMSNNSSLMMTYSYVYKSSSEYNTPIYVTSSDMEMVKNYFGNFDMSSVFKAFTLAVSNGASYFYLTQLPKEALSGDVPFKYNMGLALEKLERYKCDIIVPTFPISQADDFKIYMDHLLSTCNVLARKERVFILGADETSLLLSSSQYLDMLNYFSNLPSEEYKYSKRIMFVAPGKCEVLMNNKSYMLHGGYLASALAGRIASNSPSSSMTRKTLIGINSIPVANEYSYEEKNLLMGKGVTFVEGSEGPIFVRRASSLNTLNIADQEISVVRTMDKLSQDLRYNIETIYVGQNITPGLLASISLLVEQKLRQYVVNEMLSSYKNLKVSVSATDPRQVDIYCDVSPVFAMLWGYINLNVTL